MEPESSSPYSQVPAICPYPEPTPSSLHPLSLPEDVANSLAAAVSEPALYRLLTFHVPNKMSLFLLRDTSSTHARTHTHTHAHTHTHTHSHAHTHAHTHARTRAHTHTHTHTHPPEIQVVE